jgi:hypothetical protein
MFYSVCLAKVGFAMNWLNGVYLLLSLGVLATLPSALWVPIAFCLLPVGLLWVWRWVADWHRSTNITSVLGNKEYRPVPERSALAKVFQSMDYPLRDWVMRGHLTGATQYWVRNAWSVERGDKKFTAMEVQTTPGYIGMGIPLWRARHTALIVQSTQVWPEFVLWRDADAESKSIQPRAKFQQHRMGRKYRLIPIQGFGVEAPEPHAALALFFALWSHLNQPEDSVPFSMTQGHDLIIFWRKRPPTGEILEQLLKGCLNSTAANGVFV